MDVCGSIREFNPIAARALGLSEGDKGSSVFSLVTGTDAGEWFESIEGEGALACPTVDVVSVRTDRKLTLSLRWCRVGADATFAWLTLINDSSTMEERPEGPDLAKLHHDLQNPIASTLGFADILSEGAEGEHAEFIGYIRESASRLREISARLKKQR